MAENKFLDDIAKFGNSTLTAMSGIQRQVRNWAAEQVNELIQNMDLVKRAEMDSKIADLEKRIAALEAKPAAAPKAEKATATKTTKAKTAK